MNILYQGPFIEVQGTKKRVKSYGFTYYAYDVISLSKETKMMKRINCKI
jgi:hypothetical protein